MTFRAADCGDVGGIEWRVFTGRKSNNDLRLEIRAMEFIPPSMTLSFLLADFYAQNERTLALDGYLSAHVAANPGGRYLSFIRAAMEPGFGWEAARDQLEFERQSKSGRAA